MNSYPSLLPRGGELILPHLHVSQYAGFLELESIELLLEALQFSAFARVILLDLRKNERLTTHGPTRCVYSYCVKTNLKSRSSMSHNEEGPSAFSLVPRKSFGKENI